MRPGDVPSLGAGRGAFPVNRPPGGDLGCSLYDCGDGFAAPFWRRRANSLSRPSDLASWSCESRRSARGDILVGSPCLQPLSCPTPEERELWRCEASEQVSKRERSGSLFPFPRLLRAPGASLGEALGASINILASCRLGKSAARV